MIYLAFLAAVIWVYLLAFRGDFWRVRDPILFGGYRSSASVIAVIPARNEVHGIGRTVRSILTQEYAGPLRIVIVDDQSEDDTAKSARAEAVQLGQSERLRIMSGLPLPSGWTGKLWAVKQGVDEALKESPDFILLTDGDIEHGPNSVNQLVARAQSNKLDLTSVMVRLHCDSLAERALIPAFIFFFFMLYPPDWIRDPARTAAGAAGGCMLVRPGALTSIGGIDSIKGALIDDCALAAAIKSSGGRIHLDVSNVTHSTRIYRVASEVWSMIARTAFTQLRYSAWLLAVAVLGLALTYFAPPLLTIFGHGAVRLLGAAAWIAMSLAFVPTLKLYGRSPFWSPALPLITLFYASATLGSAIQYWSGRGGEWKGRAQAINPRAA